MRMINDKGEAVYFNPIRKNGKDQWLIQGIGSTVVLGRDRQQRKSRTFTQWAPDLPLGADGWVGKFFRKD